MNMKGFKCSSTSSYSQTLGVCVSLEIVLKPLFPSKSLPAAGGFPIQLGCTARACLLYFHLAGPWQHIHDL